MILAYTTIAILSIIIVLLVFSHSQSLSKVFFHNVYHSIIILNKKDCITFCNRLFSSMVKLPTDELKGTHISKLIEEFPLADKNFRNKEITFEVEHRQYTLQISQSVHRSLFSPHWKFVLITDISNHRRREITLLESDMRNRSLINNYASPIYILDKNGIVLMMNEAAAQFLNGSIKTFIGRRIYDNLHGSQKLSLHNRVTQCYTTGEQFSYEDEFTIENQKIYHWSNFTPAKTTDGSIYGVQIISYDITEKAKAQKEIARYQKELEYLLEEKSQRLKDAQEVIIDREHKSEFAQITTGTLHNVKNIFNSIIYASETIEKFTQSDSITGIQKANSLLKAQSDNLISFITENSKGLKLLHYYISLDAILSDDLTKLTQETCRLKEKVHAINDIITTQQDYGNTNISGKFPLTDIISDALKMNLQLLELSHIKVETVFNSNPYVEIQKSKFIHTLLNIIKNAQEAMRLTPKDKRVLSIKTVDQDSTCQVLLHDTGSGISQANLGKMFSHGFTTKNDGHGFGLHSSKQYLKEMGGDMVVTSEGEGKGATFVITLPVSSPSIQ